MARIKAKNRKRGFVLEWLDAVIWAVLMVLFLNQYFVQAYQIPSGSMRNTLIGGNDPYTGERSTSDRIFVDKLIFGPELIPGRAKIPGFRESRRGEIIIFENPEYKSPSTFHEIAQRILYMATFSLVDLNRRNGETAHQFLIKRQVAENGDRVLFRRGELFLQPKGEAELLPESDFKQISGLEYGNNLLLDEKYYNNLEASIYTYRREQVGLPVSEEISKQAYTRLVSPLKANVLDLYEEKRFDSAILNHLYPQDENLSNTVAVYERGIYVPENWALPLGDNRSNSLDGRYFGPIPIRKVLGRSLFIYWPRKRMGRIR